MPAEKKYSGVDDKPTPHGFVAVPASKTKLVSYVWWRRKQSYIITRNGSFASIAAPVPRAPSPLSASPYCAGKPSSSLPSSWGGSPPRRCARARWEFINSTSRRGRRFGLAKRETNHNKERCVCPLLEGDIGTICFEDFEAQLGY